MRQIEDIEGLGYARVCPGIQEVSTDPVQVQKCQLCSHSSLGEPVRCIWVAGCISILCILRYCLHMFSHVQIGVESLPKVKDLEGMCCQWQVKSYLHQTSDVPCVWLATSLVDFAININPDLNLRKTGRHRCFYCAWASCCR